MIKIRKITVCLSCIALIGLSACANLSKILKNEYITANPSPLALQGNAVNFKLLVKVPKKLIKKGRIYTLQPYYTYGDQQKIQLDAITLETKKLKEGQAELILNKKYTFPYTPVMKIGILAIQGTEQKTSGSKKAAAKMEVTKGIITTPDLVKGAEILAYSDFPYSRQEIRDIESHFSVGSAVLSNLEKRNHWEALSTIFKEQEKIKSIQIIGMHSPEGPKHINSELAKKRAQAVERYFRKKIQENHYEKVIADIPIALVSIVDDWSEFKSLLTYYNGISNANKKKILDDTQGKNTFEEQEKSLHKLPSYHKMVLGIYPKLRRSTIRIELKETKKSEAELKDLAKKIIAPSNAHEQFSDETLIQAAHATSSLDEKEQIFKKAIKKTSDWYTHNNLGALYLEKAMGTKTRKEKEQLLFWAIHEFNKSNSIHPNADAYNNLAMVAYMRGKQDEALNHLNTVDKLTKNVHKGSYGIRGAFWIRAGKYKKAILALEKAEKTPENLFNKGLAYLLDKEYKQAIKIFDAVLKLNPRFAEAYYGKAVVAARTQDELQSITENLKEAGKLDPNLKTMAATDIEFIKYASKEAFRNAI